jgi:hypothetical protein
LSDPCIGLSQAHIPPMQESAVECKCGAFYTRVEVAEMYDQPKVHQFFCDVCGHTLEAGLTHSVIGYRIAIPPDDLRPSRAKGNHRRQSS